MRTAGISVTAVALSALALGLTSGCTVNVPFDPSQLGQGLGDLLNQAQNNLTNLVSDPFNSHPYPWLLGGDSETVYYATNLGDIRIKFRGPTTDIVIPGILGPSNIYQIVTDPQSPYRGRELLQPLVVGGSLTGISTDGTWYAFVFVPEPNDPGPHHLVAGGVGIGVPQATVYEATAGEQLIRADLVVNDAKVAFVVTSLTSDNGAPNQLRVHDLVPSSPLPPVVIEAEGIGAFDFKNERLAYVARADLGTTTPSGTVQILLRDLATGVEKQIASYNAAVTDVVGVFLTANGVVWSETGAAGGQVRVRAYDTPTAVTRTWLDGVSGELRGATDSVVLMQEAYTNNAGADRIAIRRYDTTGEMKEVADIRADGLAGQARIAGERAVFVNPSRNIVVAPLAGGSRKEYTPY